jgi:hypothetical protein
MFSGFVCHSERSEESMAPSVTYLRMCGFFAMLRMTEKAAFDGLKTHPDSTH